MATVTADPRPRNRNDAEALGFLLGVQFDLATVLGIEPGRYVVRRPVDAPRVDAFTEYALPDRGSDVLVVSTAGAPVLPDRRGFKRRPRRLTSLAGAEAIWLNRVTYVRGDHVVAGLADGQRALGAIAGDRAVQDRLVAAAFAVTNVAIRAQSIADADPSLGDVHAHHVWKTRIGCGEASRVATGLLDEAFALRPAPPPRWQERLPSAEVVACVLGGRGRLLAADELLLRIAADIDAGRIVLAAAQLPAAIALAEVELPGLELQQVSSGDLRRRGAELAGNAARGDLEAGDRQWLTETVRQLWAATAAQRAAQLADADARSSG